MKRFFFGIALAFAALFCSQTSAQAFNDRPVAVGELPSTAQTVLNNNFTKHRIALAKVETGFWGKNYDVFLANGDKLEFDRRGDWTEIVCREEGVPTELVPAAITTYLNAAYPGAKLVKIEREGGRYEAKLANGLEFTFDKRFRVVEVDD